MYEVNTSPTADGHCFSLPRGAKLFNNLLKYHFSSKLLFHVGNIYMKAYYEGILLGYRLLSLQSNMRRRRKPKSASLKVRFCSTLSIVLSVELSSVDIGETLAEAVRGYCSDGWPHHGRTVLSPLIPILCHSD